MEGRGETKCPVFCHRRKISISWRTLFTCLPSNTQNKYQLVYRRCRLTHPARKLSRTSTISQQRVTQGIRRDYSRMTIARKTDTTSAATDYKRGRQQLRGRVGECIILLYSALRQTRPTWRCKNLKDSKGDRSRLEYYNGFRLGNAAPEAIV